MDALALTVLIVVCTVNAGLALAVLSRNKLSSPNRIFAATVLAVSAWLVFAFLSDLPALAEQALLLNRLTLSAAMLMGALLLHFVIVFPAGSGTMTRLWGAYFFAGLGLIGVTAATPLVVKDIEFYAAGTNNIAGPFFHGMVVWAVAGIAASVWVLVRKMRGATGAQRDQLKFVLLGVGMFAVASVILGLLMPMVTGSYEFAKLNTLSTLLLVGFIAYAMMRHRLMDIRLVALRAAAYTFLVVLSGVLFVLVIAYVTDGAHSQLGMDPDAVFFLAGLVVVFGFQPLRYAIEKLTDRVFYRRTYDPAQLLQRIGTSMVSTLDLEQLACTLAEDLRGSLRLAYAAVVYRHADVPEAIASGAELSTDDARRVLDACSGHEIVWADEHPPGSPTGAFMADLDARVLVPLVSDRRTVGALLLGEKISGQMFTAEDARFLDILVPEATISLRNAELFDERNQRVLELTALNRLASALGANVELDSVLDEAMAQVVDVTRADAGSIMLLDGDGMLVVSAARGIPDEIVESTRIPVGSGIAGWVAEHREPLILVDDTDPRFSGELLRDEIISAISAPVISKDALIGVLNVNRHRSPELFTRENLHVVRSFAGQLAVAIENARLYRDLESTFLGTIAALAAAVDAKDPYTFGHSTEVTEHALAIAREMGLAEEEIHTIRIASTLHDIGKIGIDGDILHKPGALTEEERTLINRHPAIGADILASLDFLRDAVPLILFHHERYGGGGYPSGISGEAIPLGARIIAVADSFNAMRSNRPYREALRLDQAMRELRDNCGTQFDPDVVEAFLTVLAKEPMVHARPARDLLSPGALRQVRESAEVHVTKVSPGDVERLPAPRAKRHTASR